MKLHVISMLLCLLALFPSEKASCNVSKNDDNVSQQADMVVFSYHRPLQLYAFLESFFLRCKGINTVCAIVRADNERFRRAYEEVQREFPSVTFVFQKSPPSDFKPLTMEHAFDSTSRAQYLVFAVDDIVLTRSFDCRECTKALEKYNCHGFFLRLGTNIKFCYMLNLSTPVPEHNVVGGEFLTWEFARGLGDWKYPENVDMTIYRKQDLNSFLQKSSFSSPTSLEMALTRMSFPKRLGLCFFRSMMVNLPLNLIHMSGNRYNAASVLTVERLLEMFEDGGKFDVKKMRNFNNNAPHFDYVPDVVQRVEREHGVPYSIFLTQMCTQYFSPEQIASCAFCTRTMKGSFWTPSQRFFCFTPFFPLFRNVSAPQGFDTQACRDVPYFEKS
jgi:hypothetical protein